MRWPTGKLDKDALRLEGLAADLRAIDAGEFQLEPGAGVELESWRLVHRPVLSMIGVAIDHPRLGTKPIETSEVYFIDLDLGIARTLSTWYRLGVPFKPSVSMSEH